jgi:hypothetical protein
LLELAADRLLDGVRNRGVWGSLPVHLFRGFARYILATAIDAETGLPLAPRIAIDQEDLPLKRSLISQIIKRLARDGKLRAIASLAHREGCISSVASVIGEIQRAGKDPGAFAAIVEARARDFSVPEPDPGSQDSEAETQKLLSLPLVSFRVKSISTGMSRSSMRPTRPRFARPGLPKTMPTSCARSMCCAVKSMVEA